MFSPRVWARAFLAGSPNPEDACLSLEVLRVYIHCALALPGYISGRDGADRLDLHIGRAAGAGFISEPEERARRFLGLMVRKGCLRYHGRITAEIEKTINRSRGLVQVFLESAFDPGGALLDSVRKKIREQAGAREVEIKTHTDPGLIGGLRLRIGGVLFDGSVKTGLQKMAAALSGT
ncbi:MAG: F0F1 ATP synthase subunit delta [Treponema sp.]|jgi:F-type H+-transporting ATPase subunit delta|nr:F0F1 ATP synthase subunit delta [Treponema sp.]